MGVPGGEERKAENIVRSNVQKLPKYDENVNLHIHEPQ